MLLKILKKVAGIFGFKLIDKNFVKNNRLLTGDSLISMNALLRNLFENNKINRLLQIGANDGKRFDEVNFFIKKYSTFCILVEPIKEYFEELKKNYSNQKNIIFENQCISVNNEIPFLYKVNQSKTYFYDDHIKGLASFDQKHLIKHGVKKNHIIKEKVTGISIRDLLKKHSMNNLDLLMIDAEAYDSQIVIDFLKNLNIRTLIIFEYIHIQHNAFIELLTLLKEKDYSYFSIGENVICVPNEKKPILSFIIN